MKEAVIVEALRTPIGTFGGKLKDISAITLAEILVKEALEKNRINPNVIDEVIIGNVLSAGLGQNVARQVAINSGIPDSVPSFTVNKLCGSGLKAVSLAAQSIFSGDNDIVIAGGTENMSQTPYLLKDARWGKKMGDMNVQDSLLVDGLMDTFHNIHMGVTAENIAEKYEFTREQQDIFAVNSQNKAEEAIKNNRFKDEIIPVKLPAYKGKSEQFEKDEYPRFGTTLEGIGKLRPAFKKEEGSVTAANASGINDGASIVIVMSREKANELGLEPLATVKSYASAGVDPKIMGCGPIPATQKALKKANLSVDDIDLIELNEAFAAQSLSVIQDLNLDTDIVNVNGGAIALGHPIGASGARILVTLLHEMKKRDSKYGLATLCIGGGQGISMVLER